MDHLLRAVLAGAAATLCAVLVGCGQGHLEGYKTIAQPDRDPLEKPASGSHIELATSAQGAPTDASAENASAIRARELPLSTSETDPAQGEPSPYPVGEQGFTGDSAPAMKTAEGADAETRAEPGVAQDSVAQPSDDSGNPSASVLTAASRTDIVDMVVTPQPGGIRLLVPEPSFIPEGPEGALRVSYDDLDLLKVLNMEPVPVDAERHFPAWLKGLDGQRVRVRGFMYPPFEETGIEMFLLARDNQICCFGRNPKIYDIVPVTMREGETTDYIQNRPFDVVGTFHIRPEQDGDELYQLYLIDDAIVID